MRQINKANYKKIAIIFNLLSGPLIALCDPIDEATLTTDIMGVACPTITVSADITLTGNLPTPGANFTIESDATPRTLNFDTFQGISTGIRTIIVNANLTVQNGAPTYVLSGGSLQLNADQNLQGLATSISATSGTVNVNYTPASFPNTSLDIQPGGSAEIQTLNLTTPTPPATCSLKQITGDATTTLTKKNPGDGTLTTDLTGFTGTISLETKSGIIDIGNNGGTLPNNVTIAGQTYIANDYLCALSVAGPIDLSGTFTLSGNNCGLNVASGTATPTMANVFTGGGQLAKFGSGTLNLTFANNYTGHTKLYGGTLSINAMNCLGTSPFIEPQGSVTLLLPDGFNFTGQIDASTSNELQGPLANLTIPVNLGEEVTISGNITSSPFPPMVFGIVKTGTGRLVLSGNNTFNAPLSIQQGTVVAGSDTFISSAGLFGLNHHGIGNLATIEFPNGRNIVNREMNIQASSTGIFSVPTGTATWTGPILGATGTLEKAGAGTLILSSTSNTYGGGTSITSGTLQAGANNTFPSSGIITLSAGTTLNLAGFNQTIGNLASVASTSTVSLGGATLTLGNTSSTTFPGLIQGAGTLIKQGSGQLTLSQANTDFTATTINAGAIVLGVNNALPTATVVTLTGTSTLDLAGFNQTIGNLSSAVNTTSVNLGAGTLTLGAAGGNTSFAGIIQGSGGKLIKDGVGTFTLSAANTYSGGTDIVNGIIEAGAQNTLPSSGIITLSTGTTLDLFDFNQTIGNLSSAFNTATVKLGTGTDTTVLTVGDANTTTYAGLISEMGSLVKQGSGTITLSNANNYSKDTTINAGTIKSGINNALPTTTFLTLSGTGALDLTGQTQSLQNITGTSNTTLTLNGASLTVGFENSDQTFAGTITDNGVAGNLIKEGTGKLTLTGLNTLNGAMTINDGILSGNSNSIRGTVNITAGKLLELNQTADGTLTASLTGAGDVSKIGGGSITILAGNDSSTFSGTFNHTQGQIIQNGQIGGLFELTGSSSLKGNGSFNNLTNTLGTISPGQSIGTITILGNFVNGANAILDIEVSPDGTSDLLAITGTATIDGTLLLTQLPGIYQEGTVYTFLTSLGGVMGNFSSIPSGITINYLANSITINLSQTTIILPVPISSLSGNAQAIGNYLFCSSASYTDPDLNEVITELLKLPPAAFGQELAALTPAQFGALPRSTFELLSTQNRLMASNLNQKFYAGNESCFSPSTVQIRTWAEGNGYHYLQNNDLNQIGYQVNNFGANIGMELILPSSFSIGFSGIYDYSALNWKENGGDAEMNTGLGMISLGYFSRYFTSSLMITGGATNYDVRRKIQFGTINRVAKNSHLSWDLNAFASFTGKIKISNPEKSVFLSPEFQIGYTNLFENGYREKGAGSINYQLEKQYSSFLQPIGKLALFANLGSEQFTLTPKVSVGYLRNIYLYSGAYPAKFYSQTLCEPNFKTQSWHRSSGQIIINANLLGNIGSCSHINLGYEATLGDHVYTQGGQINFDVQF